MIKRNLVLMVMAIMIVSVTSVSAQVISKDSMNTLNQTKDQLKISQRLNDNKIKLAKLENQIPEKTNDVTNTAAAAQRSAAANQQAATDLMSNPQDKALARKANNAASDANSDAKKARKAVDKLQDLNKDIDNLRKKIADDQQKLGVAN